VIGAAMICGVIMLALTLWVMVLVDPRTVLGSCGTVSGSGTQLVCTPRSSWAWLPMIPVLLAAVAGGFGVDRLIRRRRSSRNSAAPSAATV